VRSLGDNFGRKKVMLIGVVIFCGGSIVCAIAVNPSELVIGRIIMGIGAAASEPATLSMIRHIYPEHKARARALGAWAAVSGLALAMGPVIGGILVGIWSWRAVFWFNLVFGGLAFIAAIALPESVNPLRQEDGLPRVLLRLRRARHRHLRVHPGRADGL
jgi:multidrug resistance protein